MTTSPQSPNPAATIVVGIDGSPVSRQALDWAVRWAHDHEAAMHVVTAEAVPPVPMGRAEAFDAPVLAALETQARAMLEAEVSGIRARHPQLAVTSELTWGAPASVLVRESERASAVVVGTRGRGGWRGLLLGSVSGAVAAHARCPVIVIPEKATEDHGGYVALGADGSPASAEAAMFAFETAHRAAVPVVAVHAWQAPIELSMSVLGSDAGVADSRGEAALQQERDALIDATVAAAHHRFPDVVVERRITREDPAAALARLGDGATMIVVGSRGHGGFAGLLLGSVGRSILMRARCPVAVVHAPRNTH